MVEVIICYYADGEVREHRIGVQSVGKQETCTVSHDLVKKLGLTVLDGGKQVEVEWRRPGGKVVTHTCNIEEDGPGERFSLGTEASQDLVAETGSNDSLVVTRGSEPVKAPREAPNLSWYRAPSSVVLVLIVSGRRDGSSQGCR